MGRRFPAGLNRSSRFTVLTGRIVQASAIVPFGMPFISTLLLQALPSSLACPRQKSGLGAFNRLQLYIGEQPLRLQGRRRVIITEDQRPRLPKPLWGTAPIRRRPGHRRILRAE